ncbi:MAG TPA: hypothetical protein VLG09_03890 [Candidatus Saccharimonadales bacterium]|nr:hypothetical protein [Candidatus Saccharimonadales bacterium]
MAKASNKARLLVHASRGTMLFGQIDMMIKEEQERERDKVQQDDPLDIGPPILPHHKG